MNNDEKTMYINGIDSTDEKEQGNRTVYIGNERENKEETLYVGKDILEENDSTVYVGVEQKSFENRTDNGTYQSTDSMDGHGVLTEEDIKSEIISDRSVVNESTDPSYYLPTNTMLQKRYRINSVLGEGGFGITYSGWDITLNIPVAIKEYYPSGLVTRNATLGKTTQVVPIASAKYGTQFRDGIDRVLDEARRMAKFRNTPGIVGIYDFFEANNTAYIVMEYVEGCTLNEYCKKNRMDNITLFNLLVPVMDALQALHDEGIIHRDISPDNIMVDSDGNLKLLDFGAARGYSEDSSTTMSVILKKDYAPEEQFRTKGNQGPWTDVYALGATIYELISGQIPPTSIDRLVEDEIINIKDIAPSLTKGQADAVMTALAVRQKDRWQSMNEFKNALLHNMNATISKESKEIFESKSNEKVIRNRVSTIKKNYSKMWIICVICVAVMLLLGMVIRNIDKKKSGSENGTESYGQSDGTIEVHLDSVSHDYSSYYAYIEFTNNTDNDVTIRSKDIYLNGYPLDSAGVRNLGIVPANSSIILSSYVNLDVIINKGIDTIDSFGFLYYINDDKNNMTRIDEDSLSIKIDYKEDDLEKVILNKSKDNVKTENDSYANEEDANILKESSKENANHIVDEMKENNEQMNSSEDIPICSEDIVVTLSDIESGSAYTDIVFLIENNSEDKITLTKDWVYINDTSVKRALSDGLLELEPYTGAVNTYTFNTDIFDAAKGDGLEKIELGFKINDDVEPTLFQVYPKTINADNSIKRLIANEKNRMNLAENSGNIDVDITNINETSNYTYITFKVKNETSSTLELGKSWAFFNGAAVIRALSDGSHVLEPGKSSVIEYTFSSSLINATKNDKLSVVRLQFFLNNSEEPEEFYFDY